MKYRRVLFLVTAVGVAACASASEPGGTTGGSGGAGDEPPASSGGSGGRSQPSSPSSPSSPPAADAASVPVPATDAGASASDASLPAGGTDAQPGADTGSGPGPAAPGLGSDGLAQKLLAGSIGLGYYTACHVLPDHTVRCFGDRHPRTMPPAGLKALQITCAHDGCCALAPKEAGARIRCWSDKRTIFPPDAVSRAVDPLQIAIGYQHGCALNTDHSLTCWGQPGTMNAPPAGLKAKSIHAAAFFTCAVAMDDSVVCWGVNFPPPPAGLKAKLVSAIMHTGGHLDEAPGLTRHACAIQLDDTLRCWGDNVDGTTDVPADLGPVRDVGVNSYSTCALKPAGEMVCWGTRKLYPERYKPAPAGLMLKAIKGQFGAYCGLKLDDTLACWGEEKTTHLDVPAGLKLLVP
jgi:hypothetical protein